LLVTVIHSPEVALTFGGFVCNIVLEYSCFVNSSDGLLKPMFSPNIKAEEEGQERRYLNRDRRMT
jgi:hypothetical protein